MVERPTASSPDAARGGACSPRTCPIAGAVWICLCRGRRSRGGRRCAVVVCAQRGDVRAVAPDEEIDPVFARALRRAARAGVQLLALRCSAHPGGMELHGEIPLLLSAESARSWGKGAQAPD